MVSTADAGNGCVLPSKSGVTPRASPFTVPVDNTVFRENLDSHLTVDGDVQHHWDFEDDGKGVLSFPGTLPSPVNASISALVDAEVTLVVSEQGTAPREWGPLTEGTGGISHVGLDLYLVFDQSLLTLNATQIRQLVVTPLLASLETALGVDFHLVYNDSSTYFDGSAGKHLYAWTQRYAAFPTAYDLAWAAMFSNLPTGGLFVLSPARLAQATHKWVEIRADWDPWWDGTLSTYSEDFRWEYEAEVDAYFPDQLALQPSGMNGVQLNQLLDYTTMLQEHALCNSSTWDVYLPHGSDVNDTIVFNAGEDNTRTRVRYDVHNTHSGVLSNIFGFNFTLDALAAPALKLRCLPNVTRLNGTDHFAITYTATNVGSVPAYNVILRVREDATSQITRLTPGSSYINLGTIQPGLSNTSTQTFILTTWSTSLVTPPQSYIYYDAIADPTTDRTWTRPRQGEEQTAGHYRAYGNELMLTPNRDPGDYDPYEPCLYVDVLPNLPVGNVHVGDAVAFNVTISNLGTEAATDVVVTPTLPWVNLTNARLEVPVLNPGASTTFQVRFKVDTTGNRKFGQLVTYAFDCDYTDGEDFTRSLDEDEAFEASFNVFPRADQTFGPRLELTHAYDLAGASVGDVIQYRARVTNVGDATAYNVGLFFTNVLDLPTGQTWNYGHPPEFYPLDAFAVYAGEVDEVEWGRLQAQQSFEFHVSLQLLAPVNASTFRFLPVATFDPGYQPDGYSARNDARSFVGQYSGSQAASSLAEDGTGFLPGTLQLWQIVALGAILVVIIEAIVLAKKR